MGDDRSSSRLLGRRGGHRGSCGPRLLSMQQRGALLREGGVLAVAEGCQGCCDRARKAGGARKHRALCRSASLHRRHRETRIAVQRLQGRDASGSSSGCCCCRGRREWGNWDGRAVERHQQGGGDSLLGASGHGGGSMSGKGRALCLQGRRCCILGPRGTPTGTSRSISRRLGRRAPAVGATWGSRNVIRPGNASRDRCCSGPSLLVRSSIPTPRRHLARRQRRGGARGGRLRGCSAGFRGRCHGGTFAERALPVHGVV